MSFKHDSFFKMLAELDRQFEQNLDPFQIATVRIEQGNLYKMLIESNIFENLPISPAILDKIKTELRYFAQVRLEMLLGIDISEHNNKHMPSYNYNPTLNKFNFNEKPVNNNLPNNTFFATNTFNYPVKHGLNFNLPTQNTSTQSIPSYSKAQKAIVENELERPETSVSNHEMTDSDNHNTAELDAEKEILQLQQELEDLTNKVMNKQNIDKNKFLEISKRLETLKRPRAHPDFYIPKPSINEENQISAQRAELLSQNLHKLIRRES